MTRVSTLVLTGWLGAAIALGLLGVYRATSDRLPTIQYRILVPLVIGGGLGWRSAMMGRLTSPLPWQLFAFDLPNELVSAFPLVLVPTYLVPASVLLHLASLAKLRRIARQHVLGFQSIQLPHDERVAFPEVRKRLL